MKPNKQNTTENHNGYLLSLIYDNSSRKRLQTSFFFMLLLLLCLLVWSLVSSMAQTVQIKGQMIPQKGIAKIKHETGGEITKIHVKNYTKIAKGQLLITIDDKKINTALKQYKSKLKVVDSEISLAIAYLQNNLDKIEGNNNLKDIKTYLNNISDTVSHSFQLSEASKLVADNKDEMLKSEIKKNKIELNRLKQETSVLEEQLKSLDEQRKIYNQLLKTKNISKIMALDAEVKYRDTLRSLEKSKSDYELKTKETVELNSKRIVEQQDTIKTKYEELVKLNKEKIDLVSNIDQLYNNLKNLDILSPIDGIVQGIDVVKGVTVQPGEVIMSIVPTDSDLVFEAKAALNQKGKINTYNQAEVQFDGFNILRYNRITANIINISPYTFNDNSNSINIREEEAFIKIVAKLHTNKIESGSSNYEIKAGMSGVLYITTEEQSLFAYIFGPIYDAFVQSSTQRS